MIERVSGEALAQSITSGAAAFEYFKDKNSSYPARLGGHIRGRIGETGAAVALLRLGLVGAMPFLDPERTRECDIAIRWPSPCRVEVKTFPETFWKKNGMIVARSQYDRIVKKADAIAWCRVPDWWPQSVAEALEAPFVDVTVMGWCAVSEFERAEPVETQNDGWTVENLHLPEAAMKPLAALLEKLRGDRK
jgi:hypothetical protein